MLQPRLPGADAIVPGAPSAAAGAPGAMSFRSILAALAALACLAGPASAQMGGGGPTPVTVVTVRASDVTLTSLLPGRVVASSVAEVRPQVGGLIEERLFTEGADVKAGDPLYRLDDDTYRAELAAAEASVAQAEANLRVTELDAERNQTLIARNAISQQTLDNALAARDSARAALGIAEAQLLSAQINLDRTTIKAPLSGVIGLSQTTEGALVSAGQVEALSVIRSLDPVYVDVTQSAADLLRWRRGTAEAGAEGVDPTVSLTLADGSDYAHTGTITAAEPHVNEQTGVVLLRLTFPNPERLLLPGMYVQVEAPLGIAEGAILTPQEAVMRNSRGEPFAYVVTAENAIEQRMLTIAAARNADWVVTAGLADGDRVVVEGSQKTGPGAPVVPEERTAEGAAGAGAGADAAGGSGAAAEGAATGAEAGAPASGEAGAEAPAGAGADGAAPAGAGAGGGEAGAGGGAAPAN
ncbi:efflux RND transporter periplasmic adaptor subunit [Amaricoccus sp.]|uniref:efflux RND transporter periplasmic adaptor subunit n=1 Tax=Amaricoccus sp. TaxID=1872485 RepID=UPI00345D7890